MDLSLDYCRLVCVYIYLVPILSAAKSETKRNSLRTIPCASPGEKVYSIFKLVFAMYCLFILYTAERC